MEYNGLNIKKKCDILKKKIKDYENKQINSNYFLSEILNYWSDNNSSLFSKKINEENNKVNVFISELKKMYSIFNYIYQEYSEIGDTFKFDFEEFQTINDKIDDYVKIVDDIIELYNNIPVEYVDYIYDQKIYFINLKRNFLFLKSDLKRKNGKIMNIENQIFSLISKIDVELIEVSDYNNLL